MRKMIDPENQEPIEVQLALSRFQGLARKIKVRVLHKVAKVCHPSSLRILLHKARGVQIGEGVFIGEQVHLDDYAPELIKLANGVRVAAQTIIMSHKRDIGGCYKKEMKAVEVPIKHFETILEEDVQVGIRSIIMPGVRIGKGAIIGAGSLVTRDIPEYSLAIGVPAEVVKEF